MSLKGIIKDAAKVGLFGIGGAILANHRHKPHPVFPGLPALPEAEGFQDPAAYLSAIQQWASGGLAQLQQTQNPFGMGSQPPPGGM